VVDRWVGLLEDLMVDLSEDRKVGQSEDQWADRLADQRVGQLVVLDQ
jgi:hypothetical protein